MNDFSPKEGIRERIHWLIKLRWIAAAGVSLTVFFSSKILKFSLPFFPLYTTIIFLAAYNLVFSLSLSLIRGKASLRLMNRIANAQISLDLLSLTALIHFSGGVENPFIFYFIFHMIIAGILLSRRASFLQATLAALLFLAMAVSEYSGILAHHGLGRFIGQDRYNNFIYLSGVSFVFISTIYIAVYMAASISQKLREREKIFLSR